MTASVAPDSLGDWPTLLWAGTCLAILAGSTASWAAERPAVCHPKAGGWVEIRPAQASSHIDEATGQPKHEHSGRVDVYATNGACPPLTTSTPTGGTPSTATSTTTTTGTTTPTSPTTLLPSPSTTSSTSATLPSSRTTTPTHGTPTSTQSTQQVKPQPRLSSAPSAASLSGSPRTVELARTGSDFSGLYLGIFLAAVGGLVLAFYRRLGRGERR